MSLRRRGIQIGVLVVAALVPVSSARAQGTSPFEGKVVQEVEFEGLFPECELGAMPPFGNLYGIPVYVDELLAEDDEIAFNAGSHVELMRLPYDDFERLVEPDVASIALRARSHKP